MRTWSSYILLAFFVLSSLIFGQSNYDLSKLETLAIIFKANGGDLFFSDKFENLYSEIENLNTYSPGPDQPDLESEYERIENDLHFWISKTEQTQKYLINILIKVVY